MALCNSLPDWNTEEVSCVKRNKNEILTAVEDMAEHLPKEDPGKGIERSPKKNFFPSGIFLDFVCKELTAIYPVGPVILGLIYLVNEIVVVSVSTST